VLIDVEHGKCPLSRSGVTKWLKRDDYDSFEDRFAELELAMRQNKTLCKNMMDADWVGRIMWGLGEELSVSLQVPLPSSHSSVIF
jgi:hypothetical protein